MKLIALWLLAAAPANRDSLVFSSKDLEPSSVAGVRFTTRSCTTGGGFDERLCVIVAEKETALRFAAVPVLGISPADGGAAYFSDTGLCMKLKAGEQLLVVVASQEAVPLFEEVSTCPKATLLPKVGKAYPLGATGSAMFLFHTPFAHVSRLTLKQGAEITLHEHPRSAELLLVEKGTGVLINGGIEDTVAAGDIIHIPKESPHTFKVRQAPFEALQVYSPAGPEERFKPDAGSKK